MIQKILPGLASAPNIHTLFVHFPIALWLAALLFEAAAVWRKSDSIHRSALWLLLLGTALGTFAVTTGLQAAKTAPESLGGLLEVHEQLMLTSYFIAVGLCAFALMAGRQTTQGLRIVLLVGLLLVAIFLTLGADRGAEMVYRYGMGVNWKTAVQLEK